MSKNVYDLSGKIAIVTGSARGMGEAVAKKLAYHGAFVYVTDINLSGIERVAREIVGDGGRAKAVHMDVTDYKQVVRLVDEAVKENGRIDILVNNAGILRRHESIVDISEEDWELVMNVNVKGIFNCSKAVLPKMKERRYGKIVNISSSAGRSTSELGDASYTASKAAVLGFSRHLAREAAPFNVNVNAVCPGLIDTPMVQETTEPEELKKFIDDIPMGRLGAPEEEADLVLFLVSDASSYINGATIDITGASLLI